MSLSQFLPQVFPPAVTEVTKTINISVQPDLPDTGIIKDGPVSAQVIQKYLTPGKNKLGELALDSRV